MRSTTPNKFRCSKDLRLCANVPVCTSDRPGSEVCTTFVYEIVDNSIDEALAGYCTHIEVDILEGDIYALPITAAVSPPASTKKYNLPAVTMVFTMLHAGGKPGGSGYKVSGGLHGVGSSVVNALSTWLEVEVKTEKEILKQRYERVPSFPTLKRSEIRSRPAQKVTLSPIPTFLPIPPNTTITLCSPV